MKTLQRSAVTYEFESTEQTKRADASEVDAGCSPPRAYQCGRITAACVGQSSLGMSSVP